MSQFQFNDEQAVSGRNRAGGSAAGMAGKLVAWGVAKNQTQANFILLVLSGICIGVIIFNLLSLTEAPTPAPLVSTPTSN